MYITRVETLLPWFYVRKVKEVYMIGKLFEMIIFGLGIIFTAMIVVVITLFNMLITDRFKKNNMFIDMMIVLIPVLVIGFCIYYVIH